MIPRILTTFFVWLVCYGTLIPLSAVVVPFMLARGWEGYTTWFGNYKYGIYGNKAMPCTTCLCAWWFLVVRNPISSFGKQVLSVPSNATWPWFYDVQLVGRVWLKCGWKLVADPVKNPDRTFLFRPYWRQDGLG